jgi:hypothetical protein
VDEASARAMIEDHFEASAVTVAGGGPRDEIARASEIYADDAVLEFPQGGERIRGKADIIAMRSSYPARLDFQMHRTIGRQDLWVNEYTIGYDEKPVNVVGIMEFRDGKVARERIYFGEPWEPPAWRAQWVERMEPAQQPPRVKDEQPAPTEEDQPMEVATLASLLREAAEHHHHYEQTSQEHDWADWYAAYVNAREQGSAAEEAIKAAGLYVEGLR